MELRTALILAGVVVLAIVFLVSYDKYRSNQARNREARLRRREEDDHEPVLIHQSDLEHLQESTLQETEKATLSPDASEISEAEQEDFESFPKLTGDLAEAEDIANVRIEGTVDFPLEGQQHGGLQVDFVAYIPGKKVIRRDSVLGVYRQNEYLLEKLHRVYGLSHPTHVWRNLEEEPESGRYTDLVLTIQLTDQHGPIDETELTKFSLLVLRLSEALKRRFRFSNDFEKAQELAKKLDQFCKKYDVLAIINILPEGSSVFTGKEIVRCADQVGLELGAMNIYHRSGSNGRGQYLFSMANLFKPGSFDPDHMDNFSTKGLTMFMNLPCTRDPVESFGLMLAAAEQLCEGLRAKLVDQNHNDLSSHGVDSIRQQMKRIAQEMESAGIVPGSEMARRLF